MSRETIGLPRFHTVGKVHDTQHLISTSISLTQGLVAGTADQHLLEVVEKEALAGLMSADMVRLVSSLSQKDQILNTYQDKR